MQTFSALRSWKRKDDIPTTPELTCGQAYGVVLGTFLGKMPLMMNHEAFSESMTLMKRYLSRCQESSSAPEIQPQSALSSTSGRQSQPPTVQTNTASPISPQPATEGLFQPSGEDVALAGTSRQFDVLDTSLYQVPSPYVPPTGPRSPTYDCPPNSI